MWRPALHRLAERPSTRLLTARARNYWKSHNSPTLKDGPPFMSVIDYVGKLPSPQCEIFFGALVAPPHGLHDSAAYAHRDARFCLMNVHSAGRIQADDERCIRWARDFFKASAPS